MRRLRMATANSGTSDKKSDGRSQKSGSSNTMKDDQNDSKTRKSSDSSSPSRGGAHEQHGKQSNKNS